MHPQNLPSNFKMCSVVSKCFNTLYCPWQLVFKMYQTTSKWVHCQPQNVLSNLETQQETSKRGQQPQNILSNHQMCSSISQFTINLQNVIVNLKQSSNWVCSVKFFKSNVRMWPTASKYILQSLKDFIHLTVHRPPYTLLNSGRKVYNSIP